MPLPQCVIITLLWVGCALAWASSESFALPEFFSSFQVSDAVAGPEVTTNCNYGLDDACAGTGRDDSGWKGAAPRHLCVPEMTACFRGEDVGVCDLGDCPHIVVS